MFLATATVSITHWHSLRSCLPTMVCRLEKWSLSMQWALGVLLLKISSCYHTSSSYGPSNFVDVIEKMRRPGSWASNIDILLASLYFNIDIISFSNLSPKIEVFQSSVFLSKHLPSQELSTPMSLFVFHHQYLRPLTPMTQAHRHQLNHFCL